MKNIYLPTVLLISLIGFSQFNPNASWKNENPNSKNTSFQNDINAFNEYWKTHDKNKKGSGYKPFKRWENKWENQLNPDGSIMTPQQLWAAWQAKNNSKTNRNNLTFASLPSNWQPVGPFTHTNTGSWSSGQGRTSAVATDPLDTNIIYLGTPAGGLWKSTNAGLTWTPLSDELPQIGISGIVVDHPSGGNTTVYIATGDKDASDTYSIGILKSINGGPWISGGLTFTGTSTQAGDLIMHPTNNQILLCATTNGLYRTINGGTTWTVEQTGDFSQGSVRFKPNDPTVVYATTNTRFYKSTDTGDTFITITSGLSNPTQTGRLILDVTPADNNYVYVLSIKTNSTINGIYRSTNSGTNFSIMNNGESDFLESSQGWYDLALAVSNTNKDLIFTGCLNVWSSNSGGTAMTKMNNWSNPEEAPYTHADIHHLQYLNGKLYCLSDGGIYISTDDGASFTDLTAGLQIGMFYKISVSKTSASKMVGGLQDNGGYAFSNSAWKNYYGADGMDTAVSQTNSNLYYGFIQNGASMYITNNGGNSLTERINSPAGASGNWVTPLRGDSQGNMYSGFNGLYKLISGAWVLQNTNSVGSGNLDLISIDPSNDNIIYVSNGNSLYKSSNAGITFNNVFNANSTITSINVHTSNSNIVYITTAGRISGEALKSTDGGAVFSSIAPGLPEIGKYCIVHQGRNTDNPLYVGTELGVYYTDDTMTTWEPFDSNLPNVSVRDLEINLEDAKIIAATYGRGIWQSDILVQVPATDVKFISIINPTLNINCSSTVNPQIVVKNSGLNALTSLTINYTVDATPYVFIWSGNIAATQNQTIDLPAITTSIGTHNLNFIVTTIGDTYSDNNTGSTTFYTNNIGVSNVVNTFTNTSNELIVMSEGAGWVRGNRIGDALQTSGNTAYLTNLSGNYSNSSRSNLISQCYNLSTITNPEISFKMAFDMELNWDLAYVEYSTNLGASWNVLGTMGTNWYNSDRTPTTSGADCFNCVGAQWTGTNTTFNTYSYGLSAIGSETNVIFRIVFVADTSVNKLGVKVDDFVINGVLSAQSFQANQVVVFPNPSKGIFNMAFGNLNPNKIEVYDISGKLILLTNNTEIANNQATIDLSKSSNGIYFIKITTENTTFTKRIIKN